MKIVDSGIIRSGEQRLVRFIAEHVDRDAVRQAVKSLYNVEVNDSLEHKSGSLVVYKGEAAYRLDFDFRVNISVLLNRNGEAVGLASPELRHLREREEKHEKESASRGDQEAARKKEEASRMASDIAKMMHEINKE